MGGEIGVGQVSYKKIAMHAQINSFQGFNNQIQFICTFNHPNNVYSVKKCIKGRCHKHPEWDGEWGKKGGDFTFQFFIYLFFGGGRGVQTNL